MLAEQALKYIDEKQASSAASRAPVRKPAPVAAKTNLDSLIHDTALFRSADTMKAENKIDEDSQDKQQDQSRFLFEQPKKTDKKRGGAR